MSYNKVNVLLPSNSALYNPHNHQFQDLTQEEYIHTCLYSLKQTCHMKERKGYTQMEQTPAQTMFSQHVETQREVDKSSHLEDK